MRQLTTPEQFQELLASKAAFIVWFSAAWCSPCQKMEKLRLEEASVDFPLYYCDEVVNPTMSERAGIKQFPTFVFYSKGVEVARRMNADTTKVCQWIKKQSTQ